MCEHQYRDDLMGQIRESYGKLVYTYTTHHKMADRLARINNSIGVTLIFLTSISTVGLLSTVITNQRILAAIGGTTAALSLGLNIYMRGKNYMADIEANRKTADALWRIREDYLSLLTDFPVLSDEEIRVQRESLQKRTASIYDAAPITNNRAYRQAQKAIKQEGYQSFTTEEIDAMLPARLHQAKKRDQ
ncbi:SLATT domain-containing protein [Aeriscardovia aeriphila]|uniref:SMODS and SLOG-associating 2TM effector domain-containing protein n=1 Tax=Aeriscardovia aeriphila TaxID=218139 RepID=A0A261FCJ5_9BIFI|nr:SLATT domain-containing protein [Aeriscardovia aeriphila]NYI26327.1 hypothetical protein [Aeriscardovia aeriphila]OZG56871.1 hypothetical protein AEAE_0180 [Aeriscardovia aeriphila]